MKKVVDASGLRSPELKKFLLASPKNMAVLCECARIESLKGTAEINLRKNLHIIAARPRQVLVLKPTPDIMALRPRRSGLHGRFTDRKQTAGFGAYSSAILERRYDRADVEHEFALKGSHANAYLDNLSANVEPVRNGLISLIKRFSPDELKSIRTCRRLPEAFTRQIVDGILGGTAGAFLQTFGTAKLPHGETAYSFQFRYVLCVYLLLLKWVADCSNTTRPPDNEEKRKDFRDGVRNDFLDMNYVAYATFFDGLITRDKKLAGVYRSAVWVLESVFHIQQS